MNTYKIKELAEKWRQTEEDFPIREFLSEQLYQLIAKSEAGEIAIFEFTERLRDISSQAEFFMRLIK